ncbi:hypothetical protein [Phyllobacterium sp. OV277]|uniref:hypothetical protein n=1 Tax=Phyllobacterium sp. OV277 TaxID=1882772 RepID=UPI00088A0518|nr:hypothetical protein [Phyllobacterium sp. OV277]SDP45209.1 hypothetical protein SAMN05443582_10516 [Phyllobacterium sp. OV277]
MVTQIAPVSGVSQHQLVEPISANQQNIYEHVATTIQSMPHGASPVDVGRSLGTAFKTVADRLESGRLEVQRFFASGDGTAATAGQPKDQSSLSKDKMGNLIQGLTMSFDLMQRQHMIANVPVQLTTSVRETTRGGG